MRFRYFSLALLLGSLLGASFACDRATPVAPLGGMLTISANPGRITATGSSNITAVVRRENGTPVNPGTEVRFTSTLGRIDEIAVTDESGVARARLRGDGRVGTAMVAATSGALIAAAVEVRIGALASSITLQASPVSVARTGGVIELLALVRDDEGRPLANAAVNFQTEVGTLESRGGVRSTNQRGEVTDQLTVSETDLVSVAAPSFIVRAQVGGTGGNLLSDSTDIRIQSAIPIADFTAVNDGANRVFFRNDTTGDQPLSFAWDFTNDGATDSTESQPTHDYGTSAGSHSVRLVATNPFGSDTEIQTITVPVP